MAEMNIIFKPIPNVIYLSLQSGVRLVREEKRFWSS